MTGVWNQTGRGRLAPPAALLAALACSGVRGDEDAAGFGMTAPVACESIRGYEDYDPLARPELTADEKLLLYFRPLHFKSTARKGEYEAHFTEDVRIRRRGGKAVLWSKKN